MDTISLEMDFQILWWENGSALHVGHHRQWQSIVVGETGLHDGQRTMLVSSRHKRHNKSDNPLSVYPINGCQGKLAEHLTANPNTRLVKEVGAN